MAIQIIQTEEKLIYEAEDSKIFYRRISTLKRGTIVKRHTKRGKTDWNAVTGSVLDYVIIGWENIQQAKKDIVFDQDLIMALPEDTLTDILELSGGANPGMSDGEDQEKN